MSHTEIADEQIAFWKREGLSAKACLMAMGRPYARCGSWHQVFRAVLRASRRMGAA